MTGTSMALRRLAAGILVLVVPAAVWAAHRAWSGVTPDPLPTHWSLHGVDGTTGAYAYFLGVLVVTAALAVAAILGAWFGHSAPAARSLTAMLTFGAWIPGTLYVLTMVLARGAAEADQVGMPWYAVLGGVGIPLLAGALAFRLLTPVRAVPGPQVTADALPVGDTERVAWIGHAHSVPLLLLGVVAMAAAAVLAVFATRAAIPVGIAALAMAWASVLAVRVDQRGLHTLWGPFGWPRSRIPLRAIAAVRAQRIVPIEWGGWGYRIRPNGVAAVVRGGPGLVVQRTDSRAYAVTVDAAAEGARVLNGLLARDVARRGAGS